MIFRRRSVRVQAVSMRMEGAMAWFTGPGGYYMYCRSVVHCITVIVGAFVFKR